MTDIFRKKERKLKPMNVAEHVESLTGIPLSTLSLWREQGIGPKCVTVEGRVMYPRSEVLSLFRSGLAKKQVGTQ